MKNGKKQKLKQIKHQMYQQMRVATENANDPKDACAALFFCEMHQFFSII